MKDWATLVGKQPEPQYEARLKQLKSRGFDTQSIETTVEKVVSNLNNPKKKSFVVFGEPQSGKTEMMIALNAKLLDLQYDVIINLLTDSVDLLTQSLSRFGNAGLSPSPRQFSDLPANAQEIKSKQWLIFSKKNGRDLEKLLDSLRLVDRVVVIDDEADYASPNAKVNKQAERTRINELIHRLIGKKGKYIGVTATPARLDLNNTFDNSSDDWVEFKPHDEYTGQEFFFPRASKVDYRLHNFDAEEGNERMQLQDAVLHFLCGVAEQHLLGNNENFSMLVHTSGKMDEHAEDIRIVSSTINAFLSSKSKRSVFDRIVKKLIVVSEEYPTFTSDELVSFVLRGINKHQIVSINSRGKKSNAANILKPSCLFSFGVGGNIISRGVTFENLLSMYFTRSVRGRFTQDTYVQRARMFGSRGSYKEYMQLWIPTELLTNWNQ